LGQKNWVAGRYAFDLLWKRGSSSDNSLLVSSLVADINARLTTGRIVSVFPVEEKAQVLGSFGELVYLGLLDNYPWSRLQGDLLSYDNQTIKYATRFFGTGFKLGEKKYPNLIRDRVLFKPYQDKIMMHMTLPNTLNPFLVMASLTNQTYTQAHVDTRFKLLDHVLGQNLACQCGKHNLVFSLFSNKTSNYCPVCQGRSLLSRY